MLPLAPLLIFQKMPWLLIFRVKVFILLLLICTLVLGLTNLNAHRAAAERLNSLERHAQEQRPVSERLARVEAELDAVRAQLDRIEDKI